MNKNRFLRDYTGDNIRIDGQMIGCRVVTADDYLSLKNNWSEDEVLAYIEGDIKNYEIFELINQILALKQSHWLLRRTTHSSGVLADSVFDLKHEVMIKLKENYNVEFDEALVDSYGADTI